jgi:hypothetical protein
MRESAGEHKNREQIHYCSSKRKGSTDNNDAATKDASTSTEVGNERKC